MKTDPAQPATVEEYFARCPAEMQARLQEVRQVIRRAAPEAEERISYGMPCFYQGGVLVWYAAQKGYVGFYPTGEGVQAFKDELVGYQTTKGSVHLPMGKPLPVELIRRMVEYRLRQTAQKGKRKPKG